MLSGSVSQLRPLHLPLLDGAIARLSAALPLGARLLLLLDGGRPPLLGLDLLESTDVGQVSPDLPLQLAGGQQLLGRGSAIRDRPEQYLGEGRWKVSSREEGSYLYNVPQLGGVVERQWTTATSGEIAPIQFYTNGHLSDWLPDDGLDESHEVICREGQLQGTQLVQDTTWAEVSA